MKLAGSFSSEGDREAEKGIRSNVMTPEPASKDFRISREGTETRSPRIGTTPGLTLGPSLFSKEKEGGENG
jgi:hypothetical protein